MPDGPYSLSDLGRLADVTPRTIRYYVAQGLLPGPEAAGPATRYGEGHLLRLRLIKRLQRDHLPLAEIRGRLERMGDDEVRSMLDTESPAPASVPGETLAYVQRLMSQSGVRPRAAESRPLYLRTEAASDPQFPDSLPPRSAPVATPSGPAPSAPAGPT